MANRATPFPSAYCIGSSARFTSARLTGWCVRAFSTWTIRHPQDAAGSAAGGAGAEPPGAGSAGGAGSAAGAAETPDVLEVGTAGLDADASEHAGESRPRSASAPRVTIVRVMGYPFWVQSELSFRQPETTVRTASLG